MLDEFKDFSSQNEAVFNLQDSDALTLIFLVRLHFFYFYAHKRCNSPQNDDRGCNSVNTLTEKSLKL